MDPYIREFTFTNAQIDVQGTSSQYCIQNYKIKFKGGFYFDEQHKRPGVLHPGGRDWCNTFTFKADGMASSGGK